MMDDALKANCQAMFIVSGDSDVQPAVEWIVRNRPGIKITIYIPAIPSETQSRRTDYYRTKGMAVDCKFLPLGGIKDHQMKPTVKLADGTLSVRPHLWQKNPIILSK